MAEQEENDPNQVKIELGPLAVSGPIGLVSRLSPFPVLLAFVLGIATPCSPVAVELVRQNVDERVRSATLLERSAVADTQARMLELQERYRLKLTELTTIEENLKKERLGAESLRMQLSKQIVALEELRATSEELQCIEEKSRQRDAWRRQQELSKEFRYHYCSLDRSDATGDDPLVFARGTPNSRSFQTFESCFAHASEFLRSKGLDEESIADVQLRGHAEEVRSGRSY